MTKRRRPLTHAARSLTRIFRGEAGAGLLLLLIAVAAVVLANSAWSGAYHAAFHGPLAFSPIAKLDTLHLWINDGLMAVFFFVVGLEIKREIVIGDLADPQKRRLPVLAAALGMAFPAAIYLAVAGTVPQLRAGWAIPAATDIAFAVGVLALLGPRVPPSLRLFLLTVAIVDDLGAVVIIALFYTSAIKLAWLAAATAILGVMALLGRRAASHPAPYILLAAALWFAVLHSGVHATVAGVLAAVTVPIAPRRHGDSLLLRFEHALAPVSAYVIVPLFGLANAGVNLRAAGFDAILAPLPMAVAAGLLLGKQIGVLGAVGIAARTGFAQPPAGATWTQVWGVALLCGIGFTMSLFIGALAFPAAPTLVEDAKLGVLAGSLIAGLAGFIVLRLAARSQQVA
jgi:NhaA family Na+:H+ antiporter